MGMHLHAPERLAVSWRLALTAICPVGYRIQVERAMKYLRLIWLDHERPAVHREKEPAPKKKFAQALRAMPTSVSADSFGGAGSTGRPPLAHRGELIQGARRLGPGLRGPATYAGVCAY